MSNKIIASPIDERDFKADNFLDYTKELPDSYLAPSTWVRFQWFSSQCVAFACTQAMSQLEKLNTNTYNLYSPGLLYANREPDDPCKGEGWYVRAGLKQLYKYGTCLNKDFPCPESYESERKKFLKNKDKLLELASHHKIKAYFRCNNEDEIKRCIMQKGCVITSSVCNIKFFWSGRITPKTVEKPTNGHAYIIIGWDKDGWIIQDSYTIFRPRLGRPHISYDFKFDEFWGIEA